MTVKELKQYRYIRRRLDTIADMIQQQAAHDSVKGSNTEYPYQMQTYRLYGVEERTDAQRLLGEQSILRARKSAIERYIDGIDDPQTKEMFVCVFVQGQTFQGAAMSIGGGVTDGCVKMRIRRYVNKSDKI